MLNTKIKAVLYFWCLTMVVGSFCCLFYKLASNGHENISMSMLGLAVFIALSLFIYSEAE